MTESYANKGLGGKMKRKEGGGAEGDSFICDTKAPVCPVCDAGPRDTGHFGRLAWRNLYHYPPGERRGRTAGDSHMFACDALAHSGGGNSF